VKIANSLIGTVMQFDGDGGSLKAQQRASQLLL